LKGHGVRSFILVFLSPHGLAGQQFGKNTKIKDLTPPKRYGLAGQQFGKNTKIKDLTPPKRFHILNGSDYILSIRVSI
jgi:hypothetical protein